MSSVPTVPSRPLRAATLDTGVPSMGLLGVGGSRASEKPAIAQVLRREAKSYSAAYFIRGWPWTRPLALSSVSSSTVIHQNLVRTQPAPRSVWCDVGYLPFEICTSFLVSMGPPAPVPGPPSSPCTPPFPPSASAAFLCAPIYNDRSGGMVQGEAGLGPSRRVIPGQILQRRAGGC